MWEISERNPEIAKNEEKGGKSSGPNFHVKLELINVYANLRNILI